MLLRMPASRLGYKEGQLTFLVGVGVGSTQLHHLVPKRGQQPFAGAECSESLRGWGKDLRARPITGKRLSGGAQVLTELSVSPCRMTGLEKAKLEGKAKPQSGLA